MAVAAIQPMHAREMAGRWQVRSEAHEERVQQFVAALQRAVANDDRTALAGMMRFPLTVMSSGLRLPVPDPTAFGELYGQIFTPATRALVAGARPPQGGRASSTVVVGPGGGAVIGGAIVIEPTGGALGITQITVPAGAQARSGPAAAARRLSFRAGRPTLVNGAIDPGGTDVYEFPAGQGALIDARLDGVKGNTVVLRLVDAKTGKPLDARADRGTRVWTGRATATSDYRIEVVRQPESGAGTFLYTLSVALR